MKVSRQHIKKAFLIFIVGMLFMPLAQEHLHLFKIRPLSGYDKDKITSPPVFTKRAWIEGVYQAETEKYNEQNYGFRNLLIRLNHQIDFSLFNKLHAENVVCGKDGMFYEKSYIESYLGIDYIGNDKTEQLVIKLRKLQSELEKRNKTLLVVIAPGKATSYPDKFPDPYATTKKHLNNYEALSQKLKENSINLCDFNAWYRDNVGKTKYPLYTELGIHWTIYGAMHSFDSIVKKIEKYRGADLPDLIFKGNEESDTLRSPDDDIYAACNLLFTVKHTKTAYPVVEVKEDKSKVKPNSLVIADSYWWNIYNSGLTQKMFATDRFWYYNKQAYPESLQKETAVSDLDFRNVVDETDVIILCYTEPNLKTIGNGIIDDLISYCNGEGKENSAQKEKRIREFMDYIKNDKNWMNGLRERSVRENKPLDTLIYLDAKWQIEYNNQ